MEYKSQEVRFAEYQKAIDEILHEWPFKIINVFKSRSISPALSRNEIAEVLEERINNYEEYGCNADWFADYKDYSTFIKDIGERVGRCFAQGIILVDALIKEFLVRRPDKIGQNLKVADIKAVVSDFKGLIIQITYVASRLTFVVSIDTTWAIRQPSVQTSINPVIEIDIRPTDPLFSFSSTDDPKIYYPITDVKNDIIRLSKKLDTIINSPFK